LQIGSRPTSGCFLSSDLWKAKQQTRLAVGTKRVLLKRRSATLSREETAARPRNKGSNAMSVFVLDKRKKPLMPCSERRARLLLERGRAVVHRRYPFAIRLTVDPAVAVESSVL
jgi:hypothetical protein